MENTENKQQQSRRPLKKETKVLIAVSSSLLIIAVIVAVFFAALSPTKGGAVLWSKTFEEVVAVSTDGVFAAREGSDWVLVKDDRVISRRYAHLEHVQENRYRYTDKEGRRGYVDTQLNETPAHYTNNNPLHEIDYRYYIVTENNKEVLFSDGKRAWASAGMGAERIYKYGELRLLTAQKELPADIVVYREQGKTFLTRVSLPNTVIEASDELVFTQKHVSVMTANGWVSYRLFDLQRDEALDGASPEAVTSGKGFFTANGATLKYTITNRWFVADGFSAGSYTDNVTLIAGGEYGFILGGDTTMYLFDSTLTEVRTLTEKKILNRKLYLLDKDLVDDLGKKLWVDVDSFSVEDEAAGEIVLFRSAWRDLFRYDGNELKHLASDYGGRVGNKKLLGGDVYEVSSGKKVLLGKNITQLVTDRVFLGADNAYYNEKGKRLAGVVQTFAVYGFSEERISTLDSCWRQSDDLLFVNDKGELVDFRGVVLSDLRLVSEGLGEPVKVYGLREGYALQFADGWYFTQSKREVKSETVYPISDRIFALYDGGALKTYKAYKKSFAHVDTIAGAGLSIDSVTRFGAVYKSANPNGTSFRYGAISKDGKLALPAAYDKVEWFKSGIAAANQESAAVFSASGKRKTDFIYAPVWSVVEDKLLLQKKSGAEGQGGYVLVSSAGKELTKPAANVVRFQKYTLESGVIQADDSTDTTLALFTQGGIKIVRVDD